MQKTKQQLNQCHLSEVCLLGGTKCPFFFLSKMEKYLHCIYLREDPTSERSRIRSRIRTDI